MSVLQKNWQDLIKPYKLSVAHGKDKKRSAVIVIEPLERGFGTTLGNALRRVLLSSIRGCAVTGVKIEGVLHEASFVSGLQEDITDVVLNLKSLALSSHAQSPCVLHVKAKGPCVVTASMIEPHGQVDILDPDHVICHLNSEGELNMSLTVETGKGYVLFSQRTEENRSIGFIPIDANFSPVKRVAFSVDHTRVGQATDYDKLTLRVETNGFVAPEETIGIAARILQDQLQKFITFDEPVEKENVEPEEQNTLPFSPDLLCKVDELELSLRASNCLKNENIIYIGDLVWRTEQDMLRMPNFGKKSLDEIVNVLKDMNLSLGMDIKGWPPENIEKLAKNQRPSFS